MEKNISIKIEDVDEGKTVQRLEDIELGGMEYRHKFGLSKRLSESVEHLLPSSAYGTNDEEKRRMSQASLQSALQQSYGQNSHILFVALINLYFTVHSKGLLLAIISHLTAFFAMTKVFWIIVLYTFAGANLFMWLEVPNDLETKKEAHFYHLVARDSLLFKVEQIHEGNELERKQFWKQAIMEFEEAIDCGLPSMEKSQWTFWMAVLYCATIYTTVGYGNIACVTTGGRVATICYAICGIPLMIVVLDQLGTFLLKKMKQTSNFVDDFMFYLGVRYHLVRLDNQECFLRYISICRTLARLHLIPSTITLTVTEQSEAEEKESSNHSKESSSKSSESSVTIIGKDKSSEKGNGRLDSLYQDKRSLKIALSKGSLLDNLEPFQIESIVDPQSELAKKLLLQLPPPPTNTSRRPSRVSTATIHFKLDEADDLLRQAISSRKVSNVSKKTSSGGSAHSATNSMTQKEEEMDGKANEEQNSAKSLGGRRRRSPPLLIALLATTGWIAFAAAVFCLWEEWTYFTSVYFFFISMSTIGFGDVTPQHPQYMIMSFFVVVVGLSLVSVCINVVQEKFSQIYMEFLNKMLQQYMKAQASGDIDALKGAMKGFNERCKYLMPFISKNQGIRLMNQFKEEARAMGVELPEVMTELGETGKPAFCKIFDEKSDERVNEFLERAQNQGKMRRNAHTQTKMPQMQKTHKFFISRAEADKEEFQVQTDWSFKMDNGTQTPSSNLTDSGIQCQTWELERPSTMVDIWTNTLTIGTRNSGVQPEVSCIMRIIDDGESDFAISDYEDEEGEISSSGLSALQKMLSGSSREDDKEMERKMSVSSKRSQQMKRMAEMELSEGSTERAIMEQRKQGMGPLPHPKVTIQLASKADEEEEPNAEGAKKGRRRRMREGLRYMRNAAIQVGLMDGKEMAEFGVQIGCSSWELEERGIMTLGIGGIVDNVEKLTQFGLLVDRREEKAQEQQLSTESGPLSFETADDWLASIGAQTEATKREQMKGKKVQTERPLLLSRPVQTQLTSTFRRGMELEGCKSGEGSTMEIAQIEAQGQGGLADAQMERDELKRTFGLDDREIDCLMEKMRELKRKKRTKKVEIKSSSLASSDSSEGGEELSKEDKLELLEEIKRMKRDKMEKEEEEEEEENIEQMPKKWKRKKVEGGILEESSDEFSVQITQGECISRGNYEETILDIQLIRSPFFETKYLPQSEEHLIYAEAELALKEPKRKETEEEYIEVDKLLAKLERMETICTAIGEESRLGGDVLGAGGTIGGNGIGDLHGRLEIAHFTTESAAQTDEEMAKEEADNELKTVLETYNLGIEELNEMVRKESERIWPKWTQTNWEYSNLEEDKGMDSGIMGKEREEIGSKLEILMEKEEEEKEEIGIIRTTETKIAQQFIPTSSKSSSETTAIQPQQKIVPKEKPAKETISMTGGTAKRIPSKLKGRKIEQLVTKFEVAADEQKEQKQTQMEEKLPERIEGKMAELGTTSKVPLMDISKILLVQNESTGEIEPMKIEKRKTGEMGKEVTEELVKLDEAELEELAKMLPEFIKPMGKTKSGGLNFVWQSSIEAKDGEQMKAIQMEDGGIKLVTADEEGKKGTKMKEMTGREGGGIGLKIIPLANLVMASGQMAKLMSKRGMTNEMEQHGQISSVEGHQNPMELEYYRRWLANMFEAAKAGEHFPLYDIPLKDISEYVRLKREELSQFERQKMQMEKMRKLAQKEAKMDRMVDLSIQTGVHSRVVQIMGAEELMLPGTSFSQDNFDYLANPIFPIARIPLKEENSSSDEEENIEERR